MGCIWMAELFITSEKLKIRKGINIIFLVMVNSTFSMSHEILFTEPYAEYGSYIITLYTGIPLRKTVKMPGIWDAIHEAHLTSV